MSAVALMRRGLALADDYAARRRAFGAPLARQPLHADTLAGLRAEWMGALHLTFRVVELLGAHEAGEGDDAGRALLRVLTPLAKLTTARQGVMVASEVVEAFGGAGYVEDTGIPMILRDAQVLSIWEGTTNVLSLDTLRAMQSAGAMQPVGTLEPVRAEVARLAAQVRDPMLVPVAEAAVRAVDHAGAWLAGASAVGRAEVEAGARRFALTLGRALEAALLAAHAEWEGGAEGGDAAAAARRLALNGIDLVHRVNAGGAADVAAHPEPSHAALQSATV